MFKALHYILLTLLTTVPLGLSGLSSCNLTALLSVEAHHHEGTFETTSRCTETSPEHEHESQVPCDEDCSVELPDASLVKTSLRSPSPLPTQTATWNPFLSQSLQHSADAALLSTGGPPDGRHIAASPVFSGRFLI